MAKTSASAPAPHPHHPQMLAEAMHGAMRHLATTGQQQVVASPEQVFAAQQENFVEAPQTFNQPPIKTKR